MAKKRKFAARIIIIVMGIGIGYTGYRFHKVYKYIEFKKEKLGYKIPCKNVLAPVFERTEWKGILIDDDISFTDGAHNIIPYDLDKDGKIELVANSYRSDALMFYKCKGNAHDPAHWSRYIIDSSVGGGIPKKPIIKFVKSVLKEKLLGDFESGAHYTAVADMNGDSRDDLIVAGDSKRYDIVWYEALKEITDTSYWKKHIIHKNDSYRTYQIGTGDIDGDGNQDVVFTTKTDNRLGWLKNNGSLCEWPATWIDNNCIRCFYTRVADIDKDGQNDIIASQDDSIKGGKLHLYIYSNNPMVQKNWDDHAIANFPPGHGTSIFEIMDIDSDGDLDIIAGNHQGDVYILENTFPDNIYGEWNRYKVNNYTVRSGHDFREIDIGDIDKDGDLDITVADEGKNMVMWFENSGGPFYENWKEHVIDESNQYLRWCHSVKLGDIDGDGYLDVAVAAAGSNTFLIYFNDVEGKSPK